MKELNKENEAMYETFCRSVKKISKDCGIVQKQLAAKIGISCSQFENKINNLGSKFNLLQMYKISQELGESIEVLRRVMYDRGTTRATPLRVGNIRRI